MHIYSPSLYLATARLGTNQSHIPGQEGYTGNFKGPEEMGYEVQYSNGQARRRIDQGVVVVITITIMVESK